MVNVYKIVYFSQGYWSCAEANVIIPLNGNTLSRANPPN